MPDPTQEGFEEDGEPRCTYLLETISDDRSLGYCMLGQLGVFVLMGLVVVATNGYNLNCYVQYIDWLAFFYGMSLFCTIGTLPQRVVIDREHETCTAYLGFGWFSLRRKTRLEAIEGLILGASSVSGYGHLCFIMVKWRGLWPMMRVGRYAHDEQGLNRVKYISDQTGIPLIKTDISPTVLWKKKDSAIPHSRQ